MIDVTTTTAPKSDQLNSDDLIGRTMTIKVTKVALLGGEQPFAISFEGDNGKPYKPCKSMRRVLVHVWGNDGNAYVGRSMTLYRDEKVTFGGSAVGGIRISHMSHIDQPVTMALTASKANRKPFTVKPLKVEQAAPAPQPLTQDEYLALQNAVNNADSEFHLKNARDQILDKSARMTTEQKTTLNGLYKKQVDYVRNQPQLDPLQELLAENASDFPGDQPSK